MTGTGLTKYLEERSDIIDELSLMLKVPAEELTDRVTKLVKDNKKLAKELKSGTRQGSGDVMEQAKKLLAKCEKVKDTSIITGQLPGASIEQGRSAIDMLKKKAKSAAIVLGFANDGNVTLIAGVTDDLIKKGLKAGNIIKQVAPIVDGAGGGRPQMAQAGGKNPAKIDAALAKAKELIKEILA